MPPDGNSSESDPEPARRTDVWGETDAERQADRDSPFSIKQLMPLSPAARRRRDRRETRIGWKMAALGWEFTSQVVAGVLLGWGADYLFPNLGHWGIIGGGVAGILVGLVAFLRNAMKLNDELESPYPDDKKDDPRG
jgi:F0F1-type ATP synthase assembly protein I